MDSSLPVPVPIQGAAPVTVRSHAALWVVLEYIVPVMMVIIVGLLLMIKGPYNMHHATERLYDTFGSGDLAAVAFCALTPVFFASTGGKIGGVPLGSLCIIWFCAFALYFFVKSSLPLVPTAAMPQNDIEIERRLFCLLSIVLNISAVLTGYRLKKVLS